MDSLSQPVKCYHCGLHLFSNTDTFSCSGCTTKYGYGLFCSQNCLDQYCNEHFPRDFYMPGDGDGSNDCERCLTKDSTDNVYNGKHLCDYCILHEMGVFGVDKPHRVRGNSFGDCGMNKCDKSEKLTGEKCAVCVQWYCKAHAETFVLGVCFNCR